MAAMNVPLPSTEPALQIAPATLVAISTKFVAQPRPWIVLGIGASHPDKDWPDAHWAAFTSALRERTAGTVFLIGGNANKARAEKFVAGSAGASAVNACDLGLIEATALLRNADLFIGPSSGPLNLAAAVGTEAFGLFGSTPVLGYSKFIHALVPDGGALARRHDAAIACASACRGQALSRSDEDAELGPAYIEPVRAQSATSASRTLSCRRAPPKRRVAR